MSLGYRQRTLQTNKLAALFFISNRNTYLILRTSLSQRNQFMLASRKFYDFAGEDDADDFKPQGTLVQSTCSIIQIN